LEPKKLKKVDLQDELKKRGLKTTGLKKVLVTRLLSAMEDKSSEDEISEDEDEKKEKPKAKVDTGSGYTKDQAYVLVNNEQDPFACVLNATDMGVGTLGKNSFYKMQILVVENKYFVYTRWGRVGEEGNFVVKECPSEKKAVIWFVKNYLEKTGISWANYISGAYEKVKKKMYPVDIELEEEEEDDDADDSITTHSSNPCILEPRLKSFLQLIFDENTILSLMKEKNIDVKKMPLGKISKKLIKTGYNVLGELEKELKKKKSDSTILKDKSNQFYTVIPHDFGVGKRPPAINNIKMVQEKYELLNVLGDIEVAASILKQEKGRKNPLQHNFHQLDCDLEALDQSSEEFKQIETYTTNTKNTAPHCRGWCMGSNIKRSIIDVFRVNRHTEAKRYEEFKDMGNRKLLWHGTTAAVVAAIFKGGLRIMPHSGGRVGRGIYLASENNKSAAYVRPSIDPFNNDTKTGLMFLCEAALGKQHCIVKDNPRLVVAPPGFDSVLAQGQSEPDPTADIIVQMDGHDVVIPQGKPIVNETKSKFTQSEYLLYKESQVRIRYILKMSWG